MTRPNPLHQTSRPETAWTTVNAAENIPGVMTPLGASLWLATVDVSLCGAFAELGVLRRAEVCVPESPDDQFGGVFFGRFVGNIDRFRWASDITPGGSGDAFERQVLGSVRENVQGASRRRRYPIVALRAPAVVARLPRAIRAQTADYRAWWRFTTSPAATRDPAAHRLRAAHARVTDAMRLQMLATFVAQGIFDRLGKLAERAGCPDAHLPLMTGYGGTEETEMVASLYRVAHDGEPLSSFLAVYGARCPGENELSALSWREDPSPVERLVAKYRGAKSLVDPRTQHAARVTERETAEQAVLAGLPRALAIPARSLFTFGRAYIPLREEGKGALAMAMDGARAAARARGAELVAAGALDRAEDVFYLTYSEALGEPPTDVAALIGERKAIRDEYMRYELPQFWFGVPEPVLVETPSDTRVERLAGIAAAAGIVEGAARVLDTADGIDDLEEGEILVCRTTDPSWGAAFFLVAGVVIDIGGPASHGAIIAREMGLPCVINTVNGTRVLRTGDRLRVDGTRGIVTVLTAAAVAE